MSPSEPAPEASDTAPRAIARPDVVLIAVLVGAGLALRAVVLGSPLGGVDADEAVVGLMAEAVRGGARPVFYWNQSYGGTAETYLIAGLFGFGASAFTLKLGPMLLSGAAALVVWRLGRRLLGGVEGAFAGALFFTFPAAFVWWSTKARGFYWAAALLSGLVLLQCHRLAERAGPGTTEGEAGAARRDRADWLLLGLCGGLAWWTSPQTLYVVGPAVVWLALRRRDWTRWWPAVPGGLAGASPWLVWNATHGWSSLREAEPAVASSYAQRLRGFFTDLLPQVLGLRVPVSGEWLLGPAGVALYAVALGAFVLIVARLVAARRRGVADRRELLVVVACGYPLVFAVPRASVFTGEPRYGLLLAPVLALLLVSSLTALPRRAVAAGLAVLAGALSMGSLVAYADRHPHSVDLAPADLGALEATLTEMGVDRLYGDYWIVYPLTFDSERIVATPVDHVRVARLHRLVDEASPSSYVLFAGTPRDAALRDRLVTLGVGFERVVAGSSVVYALEVYLRPQDVEDVWLERGL